MAAYPFGGHPTLGQYLDWAIKEGCTVDYGYAADDEGRPHRVIKITAPSKRWVFEVGTLDSEFLVPTTIWRLDRRLGLKSPWVALPGKDLA